MIIDANAAPETVTYTYTEPGSYLFLQVVGNTPGPIDTLRIEVLEPQTPQFDLINCTENRVYVSIQDDYYDQLEIDFGDGTTPAVVPTSQPSFVHAYASGGEYPVTVKGLFSNADVSGCGDSTAMINTFEGETFPEATLTEVEVLDEQSIRVAYDIPDPTITYQIEVAENGSSSKRTYQLEAGSSETVLEQVEWDTRENYYCLAVTAVDPCSGLRFPSNALCTISLEAIAGDLQNNLSWQTEDGVYANYQVLRNSAEIATTSTLTYQDTEVECQETYA